MYTVQDWAEVRRLHEREHDEVASLLGQLAIRPIVLPPLTHGWDSFEVHPRWPTSTSRRPRRVSAAFCYGSTQGFTDCGSSLRQEPDAGGSVTRMDELNDQARRTLGKIGQHLEADAA